jgi:hypothetical protein
LAAGTASLDGQSLERVVDSWKTALGRDDLSPQSITNVKEAVIRWTSPSNQLLIEMVNATSIKSTVVYLDPDDLMQAIHEQRRAYGLPDIANERLGELLCDLNIRSFINQRLADFFQVPYACSLARTPFRKHLYDRAVKIQHHLTTGKILDDRYAELTAGTTFQLPVFVAVAMLGCNRPGDLWPRLGELRSKAVEFRRKRVELDEALSRHDVKQLNLVSKAVSASVESLLASIGGASYAAATAVVEEVAKGDLDTIQTGITAVAVAGKQLLHSSFTERLIWRLRRPHLIFLADVIHESQHIVEALPDFSRIWRIPEKRRDLFARRCSAMAKLAH